MASFRRLRKLLMLGACTVAFAATVVATGVSGTGTAAAGSVARPNIVFILTDDLSWNLITPQFAPHIVRAAAARRDVRHYFVAGLAVLPLARDDLHRPVPHDTHVFTNLAPNGGFAKFQSEGLDTKDLRGRAAAARLPDVDARQVPQRLRRPA